MVANNYADVVEFKQDTLNIRALIHDELRMGDTSPHESDDNGREIGFNTTFTSCHVKDFWFYYSGMDVYDSVNNYSMDYTHIP